MWPSGGGEGAGPGGRRVALWRSVALKLEAQD